MPAATATIESDPLIARSGEPEPLVATARFDFAFIAVAACFLLSGFAALLYQAAWMRQFGTVFGTSHLAVATVLAAYMGGLAAGAWLAGRFIERVNNPLRVYGFLEAGIALSALALPFAIVSVRGIQALVLGGQADLPDASGFAQSAFYTVTAFVVLALPTTFMGATLPLLTRYAVRRDEQVGPRIGFLYGINTTGAVLGAVAAGFLLIPALGLFGTVVVGVIANGIVFVIAVQLARHAGTSILRASPEKAATAAPARGWHWVLPLILLSGANAFFLEVLWTRLLNHVLGGTLAAFSTMLATFLTGIAIGGAVSGQFATNRETATRLFILAQLAIGILSLVTYQLIDLIVPGTTALPKQVLFAAAVMLPTTLFIGATFPLAVRMITNSEMDATLETSRVYAWNTVGAIIGALAAGFVLIPLLGFSLSAKMSGLVSISLAAGAACLLAGRHLVAQVSIGGIALLVVFAYDPPRPEALFRALTKDAGKDVTELYYGVGRSATIIVSDVDGSLEMRSEGLPESTIFRAGSPPSKHSQYWLTALPSIARPDAEHLLMIGLGGGVALEALPDSLASIDVVEIEPEVIAANRRLAELRRFDPLADPRVRLVLNDARSALSLSARKYDIIVSQPSHPWTAGASHLYTREFLQLAASRLNEHGVLLQWINAQYIDAELLQRLTATVAGIFSNVRLYNPLPNVLLFLASDGPLTIEQDALAAGSLSRHTGFDYRHVGISSTEDIASALLLDEVGIRAFAEGIAPNTDNNNRLATHSYPLGDGLSSSDVLALLGALDELVHRRGALAGLSGQQLDWAYVASQLVLTRFEQRAFAVARSFEGEATGRLIDGIGFTAFGQVREARAEFAKANEMDPASSAAAFSMLRPYLRVIGTTESYARLDAAAAGLPEGARAVIAGWQAGDRGDWASLESLDDELAAISATDQWYPLGVKLRVDWRLARAQASGDPALGREGLALLDDVLAFYWNFDLYVLRAACAFVAGDADAFLESAWWAGELVAFKADLASAGRYQFSDAEYRAIGARLAGLLREVSRGTGADQSRRAMQVQTLLRRTLERLAQMRSAAMSERR